MIEVFRGASVPGVNFVLDAMHQDRKRVFVDLLKWNVPVVDGRFEVDQFDNSRAIYLVATSADDAHLGSIRLLPTTSDHILGGVFPSLCDGPVPQAFNIYEISRGCVAPRLKASRRLLVRNALTVAAAEFALMNGISAYTCIAASAWLRQIPSLGWDCQPLGLPQRLGRALTGALRIEITPDTPHLLRQAGTVSTPDFVIAAAPERAAA
jgi:N-acyl-L-homoserine lactone synthetase